MWVKSMTRPTFGIFFFNILGGNLMRIRIRIKRLEKKIEKSILFTVCLRPSYSIYKNSKIFQIYVKLKSNFTIFANCVDLFSFSFFFKKKKSIPLWVALCMEQIVFFPLVYHVDNNQPNCNLNEINFTSIKSLSIVMNLQITHLVKEISVVLPLLLLVIYFFFSKHSLYNHFWISRQND